MSAQEQLLRHHHAFSALVGMAWLIIESNIHLNGEVVRIGVGRRSKEGSGRYLLGEIILWRCESASGVDRRKFVIRCNCSLGVRRKVPLVGDGALEVPLVGGGDGVGWFSPIDL